jgi:site-specific recombinase XerD
MQVRHARAEYIRWLLVTRDLSSHTIRAYASDIAAFERFIGDHAAVGEIDHDRVVTFVEALQATSLSPKSVRRRASGVRGFCAWLNAQHLIDADPWLGVCVPVGRSRDLPRLVEASDVDRLLGLLSRRAGASEASTVSALGEVPFEATTLLGVAMMIATGVRVSELVGIRTTDIDLRSGKIRIVGKGRRERVVYLTNDWISGLVRAYLQLRLVLEVGHRYLLFNRRRDPLTAAAMRSRLAKVAEIARIDGRVTPHMLRHTAATQLIEAGVDIRLIQRLLGHASLSTTEIYTHVSDVALKRVLAEADVLGRALNCR